MNVKLLLAESLDTLRKGEEREAATDKLCEQMSKRSASERNFAAVRKEYSVAYDIFIKGLEMINHCRRTAINAKDNEMVSFCAEKMGTYMDRCERIRTKEGNILMNVAQVEATGGMDKEGYEVGESVFFHEASKPIKGSEPIQFTGEATDGAYQLLVKNFDDYAVAAPLVQVALQVTHHNKKVQTFRKTVPTKCAWSRYIGIVDSGTVKIQVLTDAWMRQSSVEVNFRKLIPTDDASSSTFVAPDGKALTAGGGSGAGGGHWVDALPPIPNMDDLLPVPGGPVEGVPAPGNFPGLEGDAPIQCCPGIVPFGEEQSQSQSGYQQAPPPMQQPPPMHHQPPMAGPPANMPHPAGPPPGQVGHMQGGIAFGIDPLGAAGEVPSHPPMPPTESNDRSLGAKAVSSDADDSEDDDEKQLRALSGIIVPHVAGSKKEDIPTKTVHQDPTASKSEPTAPETKPLTAPADYITPVLDAPVGIEKRLQMATMIVEQFPTDGVKAVPLNRSEKLFLHSIQQLPIPTEVDFDGVDFGDMDLADLGDERDDY